MSPLTILAATRLHRRGTAGVLKGERFSGEVFRDPVLCADGHTYERHHIEQCVPLATLSLPTAALSLPTAALSLPTAALSLPTAALSLPTAALSLPTAALSLPTAALSCQPPPYPTNRRHILPTASLSRVLCADGHTYECCLILPRAPIAFISAEIVLCHGSTARCPKPKT